MKGIFFISLLFISVMPLRAQLSQHGLLLSGGMGRIDAKIDRPGADLEEITYKFVEIGISGKYGTAKLFETDCVKSGKIREIQLSAFIPF